MIENNYSPKEAAEGAQLGFRHPPIQTGGNGCIPPA